MSVICPMNAVHKIITDDEVSKEYIRKAQQMSVSLVLAGRER